MQIISEEFKGKVYITCLFPTPQFIYSVLSDNFATAPNSSLRISGRARPGAPRPLLEDEDARGGATVDCRTG